MSMIFFTFVQLVWCAGRIYDLISLQFEQRIATIRANLPRIRLFEEIEIGKLREDREKARSDAPSRLNDPVEPV